MFLDQHDIHQPVEKQSKPGTVHLANLAVSKVSFQDGRG